MASQLNPGLKWTGVGLITTFMVRSNFQTSYEIKCTSFLKGTIWTEKAVLNKDRTSS